MSESNITTIPTSNVSIEVAELDFGRFCVSNRIKVREEKLDQEDLAAFRMQKDRIIEAIMDGYLIITDEGQAVYTAENGQEVKFKKPLGGVLTSLDRTKQGENIKGMFLAMGELTSLPANTFSKMDLADTNNCIALATLFLGS